MPARAPSDWRGITSLLLALLSLVSCVPWISLAAGLLAWNARRRAQQAGRRTTVATAAICITAVSIALQIVAWQLASNWLVPAMHRRTVSAITAAFEGRVAAGSSAQNTLIPVAKRPEPDAAATEAFARRVQASLGALRSVSTLNESVAGSTLAPTVSMALVLTFERGTASGAATVQWHPATEAEAQESWLPSAHVIDLEVTLPDGSSARLEAPAPTDGGSLQPPADPSAAPAPASAPAPPSAA